MTTIRFFGQILPSANQISMKSLPPISWFDSENHRELNFSVSSADSIITVVCECPNHKPDEIVGIWMRAQDVATAFVNLVAFAMGIGLVVVFESFQVDGSEPIKLSLSDPVIPALCTAYNLQSLGEVVELVVTSPPLFMAINDLITSITFPHQAVINAYRAIETIRHLLSDPEDSIKTAWQKMRTALNIDYTYISLIANNSTDSRHGNRKRIDGLTTTEVTHRAWAIMNRYLEMRKRQIAQLPLGEFPMLSG